MASPPPTAAGRLRPAPRRPPPYAAVAFDCDSTLTRLEGIDELARGAAPAVQREVASLTEAAMAGRVALEEVFARRLALVRPGAGDLARVAAAYVAAAVPSARELVAALRSLEKRVAIVSGGLEPAVATFARWLGVDEVHAVGVRLDAEGAWLGFDESSPLARAGGKAECLARSFEGGDVAFVGDGATDAEAAPACARFVAFAGVVMRPDVARRADVVVAADDLAAALPALVDARELDALARDPRHSDLVARALALR